MSFRPVLVYFLIFLFLIGTLFGACNAGNRSSDPIDRHTTQLVYTRHARCRMDCRHITEKEVKEILENGDINYAKSDPYAKPDPKYALDGYTQESQHLRIVFAPSSRGLVVITCIELDVEWQCDCH